VSEAVTTSGHSPLPLACTLEPLAGPARLLRWQRLHEQAAPVVDLQDGQLEVRYQCGPGVLEELTDLVAAEQRCCSFIVWTVDVVERRPVLRVKAPPDAPDAIEPIAALFVGSRSGSVASP
jgi:hypothetical protein